jgi:hypothetical protein
MADQGDGYAAPADFGERTSIRQIVGANVCATMSARPNPPSTRRS